MLHTAIVASILLLSPTSAHADELFSASQSIAKQPTNWSGSITLPQFNRRGILTGLRIEMDSHTDGKLEVESVDEEPATILSSLNTYISVHRPNTSKLFTHSPSMERRDEFTAYDGSIDYDGNSGQTHTFVTNDSESKEIALSDNDAQLFSGEGTVELPITAIASTNFSGAGNLRTRSTSIAGVTLSISYLYSLADLVVSIDEPEELLVGTNGIFTLNVQNIGDGATVDATTVTMSIPLGLVVLDASGEGFTCNVINQLLTCIRNDPIGANTTVPISVTTLVTSAALPAVTLTSSVTTTGDNNTNNNAFVLRNAEVTVPDDPIAIPVGTVPTNPETTSPSSEEGASTQPSNTSQGGGTQTTSQTTSGITSGGGGQSTGPGSSISGGGFNSNTQNSFTFSNALGGFGGPEIDAYSCPLSNEDRNAIALQPDTACFSFDPERNILFTDIANDPNRNIIDVLRKTKIVSHGDYIVSGSGNHSSGKQEGKYKEGEFPFEPKRGSSRLEVVKLALLSNCLPIDTGASPTNTTFSDVIHGTGSDLDLFTADVFYTAAKHGIAKGFDDGTARPYERATNAEALAFLLRASNAVPKGYGLFTEEHWFDDYTNFAITNHIVPVDFDPFGTMTRSELSAMLLNIMAINPNPAVYSYVQQVDARNQVYRPQEYVYTPHTIVGSLTVDESSSCSSRDPNVVPCLGYNEDRSKLRHNLPSYHWAIPYMNVLQRTFLGTTVDYMFAERNVASQEPARRKDVVHAALVGNCRPKHDTISESATAFNDLNKDNTNDVSRLFYTAVEEGVITGYNDGTVRPDHTVTRLEALIILLRAAKALPDGYTPKPLPFSDLKDGEWYHSYVSFAVNNNIIQNAPTYRPNQPVLRSELASLAIRTMRFARDVRVRAYLTSMEPLLR